MEYEVAVWILQEIRPINGEKRTQNRCIFIATHLEDIRTLMQRLIFKKSLQKFHYPYHRCLSTTKYLIVHFHPFAAVGPIFNNWVAFPVKTV